MSKEGSVEQQDARGWTPIMWSSCNGFPKLVRQLIQQGANVGHFGQARNGMGTTSALHECACMQGEKGQSPEAYYECAWLLMAAGQSPFQERSDGSTAIDVAAMYGQLTMKTFLEGCALFRGTLKMSIPVTFGTKQKNRYCIVHPRFPFTNAAPTLWMTCFRGSNEVQSTCKIPLGNARVVIEGGQDSSSGILIIPSTSKLPKGVAVRSHTQNSSIVEVTAVGSPNVPGWKTLRTLADVCKAAGVAVSCHSLDQLCAAALRSAVKQMQIPGTSITPELGEPQATARVSEGSQNPQMDPIKEEPQIADSAQDMTQQSQKSLNSQGSMRSEEPRLSAASQASMRRSSGLGRIFKSAFRLSSSTNKPKYNQHLLDSSSSLGQISSASAMEQNKKGLFGLKKGSSKSKLQSMPSISEQQGAQISQNIPDKFWSKMGRKLSTQNSYGGKPMTSRENIESWFHEDDGIVSPANTITQQKGTNNAQDLNELMFPSMAKEEAPINQTSPSMSAERFRRQTTDGPRFRANQTGPMSFVLEEPIVPTQPMVPSGPRRSFSFDDLDDFMSGGTRKARGHREGFADQMSPAEPQNVVSSSPKKAERPTSGSGGKTRPLPEFVANRAKSMPRRSFSFHDLDQLLGANEAQAQAQAQASQTPRTTIEQDLQAWQKLREQRGLEGRKSGPMIDPASYGGYQGAYAPEWRQYTPPSPRPVGQLVRSQIAGSPQIGLQGRSSQGQNPRLPHQVPGQPLSSKTLQIRNSDGSLPGSRSHSLSQNPHGVQNQAQAANLGSPHQNLAKQPSRKFSQPLSPTHPQSQIRPGVPPNNLQGSLSKQHSIPRQGWVSPALQSAQRHALESQIQQRKSAGSGKGSIEAQSPRILNQGLSPNSRQIPSRSSQGADKKSNKSLEEYLIGPELANLAALRALETGTLSSGSPRKSENPSSPNQTSNEILSTQPVTRSEKRRKSKERDSKREKDITRSSSSQPVTGSKDLLGSGSQPGSLPQTPRISGRRASKSLPQNIGSPLTSSVEGTLQTRSGRTPAERLSQNLGNENGTKAPNENVVQGNSAEPVLYESAQPQQNLGTAVASPSKIEYEKPSKLLEANLNKRATQEKVGYVSKETRRSSAGSSVSQVSLAVPSALFHGVKAPKFATPPKRIAPERQDIPEIPEHRDTSNEEKIGLTPERPSVGFGA